jgi:hypothetical protein
VRLALAARRSLPPPPPQEDSWYSFLLEAESTEGHSAAAKIRPIKKSNDLIGNRTRDLPACNTVSQPSTLLRALICLYVIKIFLK